MSQSMLDIARGFARLPREKRRSFLTVLSARGIAFSRLPVPPLAEERAQSPLTPAQQQIWRAVRLAPQTAIYNMPGVFDLTGALSAGALEQAFVTVIERHAILRTVFHDGPDGSGRMVPLAEAESAFRLGRVNLRDRPSGERESDEPAVRANALIAKMIAQPFDLTREAPIRADLLTLAEDRHVLVTVVHHLVADGGSVALFMSELAEAYRALTTGTALDLTPLTAQYADIAAWRAAWLDAGEGERQADYWRQVLADPPEDIFPDPAHDAGGLESSLRLPPATGSRVASLATEKGCPPFAVLLAAYALLVGRMYGKDNLIVGAPFDGRRQPEAEPLVGCFVNILPLRIALSGTTTFAALVDTVAAATAAARDYGDIGLDAIEGALRRIGEAAPPVRVTFDHAPLSRLGAIKLPGLTLTVREPAVDTAKFDLALATVGEANGGILARFAYRSARLSANQAERFLLRWAAVLERALAAPTTLLRDIDIRTTEEARTIACWHIDPAWAGAIPEPIPHTLARLARARPDAPAVFFGDATLSRSALNCRANRLAHRLIGRGAGAETRIGICLERSFDLVISLLAVMKSGAAFVPLDPADPPERKHAIAAGAGLALLITREDLDDLPTIRPDETAGVPDHNPAVTIHPGSLAYIIHTSGSTGQPKGVMVEHGPLAAHCAATGQRYDMGENSRELHFLSFTFDGAHERWMTALSVGGSIVLRDDTLWPVDQTLEVIERFGVTHAGFPPKYLQQLAEWAERRGAPPPQVQLYSFGGEAMPKAGLEAVFRSLRPRHAINGYGPTETVVTPLVWKGDGSAIPDSPHVPIGRPVGDRTVHILDSNLNPAPIGMAGELWIGGGGLARGYASQPAMTAERFIPDLYSNDGGRLYRTGDLARWMEDGTVEYLGRRDHQVKVRGFRIEPGEIEAHLAALPDIREAAVIARADAGVTRLVAYVTSTADRIVDPTAALAALATRLPPHMVPARLMVLAALPVTVAGKLDRAALPAPDWGAQATVAPRNPLEARLLTIWQSVLGQSSLGITDNFFDIGGDSILALQIVARARTVGLRITPKQLLEGQTVEALARVAEGAGDAMDDAAKTADEPLPVGPLPLTPIQAWFFTLPLGNRHRWNQSVLLRPARPTTLAALTEALTAVATVHPSLRLRFQQNNDGAWHQTYADIPAETVIPVDEAHARDAVAVTALCDDAQGGLDITAGPVFRVRLIHLPDSEQRLFLVAHHLVVDGVSWRILLSDLQAATVGACARLPLPTATTTFGGWARRLADSAPRFMGELPYWRAALDARPIPVDRPEGANTRAHAALLRLELDPETTTALLTDAAATYRARIDILLLAALAQAVTRRWKLPAVTVHLEGHGREALFADVDLCRTIGWFTSVFPVSLASAGDWDATLRTVKETLRGVPQGGIGYGVLRCFGPPDIRADLTNDVPSLSFNYLGQFDNVATGDWQLAVEDTGSGTGPDAPLGASISIDGQVLDGKLALRLRYSSARFDDDTIARLCADFRDALTAVIAHCRSVPSGQATPSDFPLAQLTQTQINVLPLPAPAIADVVPPSPLPAAMLRHGLRQPHSTAYTVQVWARVEGLDPDRIEAAWQAVVARHAGLRLYAGWPGKDSPVLVIAKPAWPVPPVERLDFTGHTDPEAAWATWRDRDYARSFAVDSGEPLARLSLAWIGANRYRFLWTWHHALLDGWSMSRVLGELLREYDGERHPPPGGGPGEIAAWRQAQGEAAKAAAAYWQARLDSLPAPTLLGDALGRPPAPAPDGAFERTVEAADVRAMQRLAAARKVTVNTLVQAAWAQTLAAVTGQRRVAFGVVGSGRSADMPGIEDVIALMAATLPLVHDVGPTSASLGEDGAAAWLQSLFADNVAMRQHEQFPPPSLQCWPGQKDAAFDSLLIFENFPVDDALWQTERGEIRFSDVGNRGRMSYPLTLVVVPRDTLTIRFEYCGGMYTPAMVTSLADTLARLLSVTID